MELTKIRIKLKKDKLMRDLTKLRLNRTSDRLLYKLGTLVEDNINDSTPVVSGKLKGQTKMIKRNKNYSIINKSNKEMYYNLYVHRDRKNPNPFYDIGIMKSLSEIDEIINNDIDLKLQTFGMR